MLKAIKETMFRKKTLYTICFIMLGMIDFVRHTQQEMLWGPAVNCAGILLLVITASQYKLKELKCCFSYIWSGGSVVLLFLTALWQEDHFLGVYKWTVFTAVINVWLIGILLYRIFKKIFVEKTIRVRWNALSILGIVLAICMMLSPYRAVWPVWFLSIFGLFYLTRFERTDFFELMEAMVDGTIMTFFGLQIYAYGHRPFDDPRYLGAFSNSNMTALHYLMTYTAILLKLHFLEIKGCARKWKLFSFVGAAGLLDFQILTMTRTAWVISVVITVLFGTVVVKKIWLKSWKVVLGRAAALGLCVLVLFPVVFASVRWLPPLRHHPIWYAGEWNENKVHSFDPPDSEKYTDFDEFMGDILERLKIIGSIDNPLVLKVQAAENMEYRPLTVSGSEHLTQSLQIRFTIYKGYLEDLNWVGHGKAEGHYIIPDLGTFVWHPQNVWIQVAYYYGIPAGVLFLVLTILILVKQVRAVLRQKQNVYAFVPLFISIIFFMYGMMEIVWIIGQFILFLFLFALHPQFGEK